MSLKKRRTKNCKFGYIPNLKDTCVSSIIPKKKKKKIYYNPQQLCFFNLTNEAF